MRGPILAHIIGGGPVWPLWLTGALLFGGAVAAMAVPHALRRICLAVAGVGLVATVAVYVALPSAPPAPAGLSPEAVRYIHKMAYDRKAFAAASESPEAIASSTLRT